VKKQYKIVFTVFGFAVFVYLVWDFGIENIITNVQQTGWWFIPIIGVWGIVYLLNALAWHAIIAKGEQRVKFAQIFSVTLSGFAINYVTPFLNLGGEPYRVLALRDMLGMRHALSSVILYNMLHMLSHLLFWLVAVGALAFVLPVSTGIALLMMVTSAVLILIIGFFFSRHKNGIFESLLNLVLKIGILRPLATKLQQREEGLLAIDKLITELYSAYKGSFFTALFLEFVARVVAALEFYFMFLAIGLPISLLSALYIYAASSLILNILFFMPFELGAREGSLYLVAESLGMTAGVGIYAALINRVREFFWILIGLALIQLSGQKVPRKELLNMHTAVGECK